jgi:hypothetical protein
LEEEKMSRKGGGRGKEGLRFIELIALSIVWIFITASLEDDEVKLVRWVGGSI